MSHLRQLFLNHVGQTSPEPMMVDVHHAAGIYIYDQAGKRYADMTAGICVSALGHSHPVILDAVRKQADRYMHTMVYGEHVQAPQVLLAACLADVLPNNLDTVYFTNSGSEATEGAIKLVRKYTGRSQIIACKRGYHGSTIAAMSLMSEPLYKQAYQPALPGIKYMDFNSFSDLGLIAGDVAAVIVEPVRGPAGVEIADKKWLRALRVACDEVGCLLVFDEIQCGMGRTGQLFAFMDYGVVPDVLLLAKALGGGMPIGALIASNELLATFVHNPSLGFISTFGGHPVCCAAGYAALNYLLTHDDLLRDVLIKERVIHNILTSDKIMEIRSKGLLIAVELADASMVRQVIQGCFDRGVLIDRFLFDDSAFRIAPPLTITHEELEEHIRVIQEVIDDL